MKELRITCEHGNAFVISEIHFVGAEFTGKVFLKADWYNASFDFRASSSRLRAFKDEVYQLVHSNHEQASFINDGGNVDLEFVLDRSTGQLQITGVLIKNMMDDSRVEYCLESSYSSLKGVLADLEQLLP